MAEEISEGVFLIDTLAAGFPGLVSGYLIKGDKCALVDAGYPTSGSVVLSDARELIGKDSQVDYLIPTHVHLDHAGAIGYLAREMPASQILVNEHGAKHLVDPTRLTQTAANLFGNEAMLAYGTPIPSRRDRIQPLDNVHNLDLGQGKKLRIFWTPGHAWHHMSAFLEEDQFLITGDAVGLRYPFYDFPIPATPPPGFDAEHYQKSLSLFIEMNPVALLLPHFGPVRKNVRGLLQTNLETVERWVSIAAETVERGGSFDQIFSSFLADIASRSGRSESSIPDYVKRSIMLSAMGCCTYAQERTRKE